MEPVTTISTQTGIISVSDKQIQIAKAPRLKETGDKEIFDRVQTAILRAYLTAGHSNYTSQSVQVMSHELARKLKNDYPNVSLEGVLYAINKGAYGEYLEEKEVLHISPANIIKWVRKYIEGERKEALILIAKEREEALNKPKPEPTPEELLNIKLQHVLTLCDLYVNEKPLIGPRIAYEVLSDLGFIVMTNDEKKALYEKKKQEFYGGITKALTYSEKRGFDRLLNDLLENPDKENIEIRELCYVHCLEVLFKKWKSKPIIENNTLVWKS